MTDPLDNLATQTCTDNEDKVFLMVGYPGPAGLVIPAAMVRGVARSLLPPGRIPAAWSWPTPTCEQALPIGELAYAALAAGCGYVNILGQGLDAQVVAYVAGCLGPVAEEMTDVSLTRARMGTTDFLGLYARRGDAEAVVLPYHLAPSHVRRRGLRMKAP